MPKPFVFTAKEMQGNAAVSPFIAPVAPPKSTIATDLAEAGKQGYADYQSEKLATELETAASDFIAQNNVVVDEEEHFRSEASDFDSLTPHEQNLLAEAENKVKKAQVARDQGKLTSPAFKAKTEVILKGYINTAPGLTKQFKKVGADVLGFDSMGASLKNAMDEATLQNTANKNEAALQLFTAKEMQKANHWTQGKSIEWNMAHNYDAFARDKLARDTQEQLQKTKGWKEKDQKAAGLKVLRSTISYRASSVASAINEAMNNMPMSAVNYAELTGPDKENARAALDSAQTLYMGELQQDYWMLDQKDLDAVSYGPLKMFEEAHEYLSGTRSGEQVTRDNQRVLDDAKALYLSKPNNAYKQILLDSMDGIDLPIEVQEMIAADWAANRKLMEDNSRSTPAELDKNYGRASSVSFMNQVLENYKASDPNDVGTIKAMEEEIISWTNPLFVPNGGDEMQVEVFDHIYKAAADWESFQHIMATAPTRLKENYREAAGYYIPRIVRSMAATIEADTGSKGFYELTGGEDGKVFFQLSDKGREYYHPSEDDNPKQRRDRANGLRNTEKKVDDLNQRYRTRLNNVTKSADILQNWPDHGKNTFEITATLLGRYTNLPWSDKWKAIIASKTEALKEANK